MLPGERNLGRSRMSFSVIASRGVAYLLCAGKREFSIQSESAEAF